MSYLDAMAASTTILTSGFKADERGVAAETSPKVFFVDRHAAPSEIANLGRAGESQPVEATSI
jgi:hypothetical protein